MILRLPHLTFYYGKEDAVGISTGDTTGVNGFILETELHLTFIRKLFHLTLHGIQNIPMESSILNIMVVDDLLMILAIGKNSEKLL